MKKYALIIFIFVISIVFSAPVYAQPTKDAVMGLKKLQARCQSGISYRDYSNAVADAKFPVNVFIESADAKKSPELTESINKAMGHYEYASKLWNLKMSGYDIDMKYGFFKVDSDVGREISKLYAQAAQALTIKYDSYFIGDLLPMIWDSASQELGNTTKLLAKMEETSASELANLKKENNGLKTEIEKLKQENASLRAKQKKK